MVRTSLIVLTLPLATAVACAPGDAPPTLFATEVRDSAGITIVENARPPDGSRLEWRIGPEPTVSIGVVEGEEPYMLHGAFSSVRLPDGRIVVANLGSQELRVFDSSGSHLATLGGRGEGPGEFTSLVHVARWPGDSIAAWHTAGLGIAVFDSDGRFGRSFALGSSEKAIWLRPRAQAVREVGDVLSITAPEGADTAVVELRDGEGALLSSLGTHRGREVIVTTDERGSRYLRFKAYGRELVAGLWGDHVVASPNDRYEIRAFGADGALARIVRRSHELRAPTEADRAPYVEEQLSYYEGANLPEALVERARQEFETTPFAATFPAFSSILGDATGHLWVEAYQLPRDDRPGSLWTVFGPDGRALGFVETPDGLEIHEIGEDYILGAMEDDLGVESVQLWPLERS